MKIYKMPYPSCYPLLKKGVKVGEVVRISLPFKKGRRKLYKAVVRMAGGCECCGSWPELEVFPKANGQLPVPEVSKQLPVKRFWS